MTAQLVQAQADLARAQLAFEKIVVAEYPVGSTATWWRNSRIRTGKVIRHGFNGRLMVRNGTSIKSYWISAGDIIEAIARLPGRPIPREADILQVAAE
ncbi:hypothetical protein JQ633_12395 [Bradyrhizobium tropiciagri]|uniref:hypothetical protein n=1 Tax=Bradyrhizobium tropiciagri TaxID=312253 RepID=UPI001BAB92C6|nr:hypothetical protein [Bradyrhizobium tropiciagri]MBR0871163.1 hypothetical protein [Bradyrhizobium tropiciagri]